MLTTQEIRAKHLVAAMTSTRPPESSMKADNEDLRQQLAIAIAQTKALQDRLGHPSTHTLMKDDIAAIISQNQTVTDYKSGS